MTRESSARPTYRRRFAADSGGFTLIEILVSVLILGMIFSFIFVVLSSSLTTTREAMKKMEVERVGRYFISRIASDLTCATLLPASGIGGMLGTHFSANGKSHDEVHFTAFTQSYFNLRPPTDQAEIGYYFRTAAEGKSSLMRRESDIIEKPVTAGGEAFAISDMVEELSIKYRAKEWQDNWVDNWDSDAQKSLPAMISIELKLDDGKTKYFFSTVVKPVV
ncbi:MAG: prepilin-type N-terminal cleavage/methylation domain-containing protein [Nitrospinae bacterium]|nr:prepilin-type N-terminal cleavage/methylation domain-containing protein [Nitrospinota bacterium]